PLDAGENKMPSGAAREPFDGCLEVHGQVRPGRRHGYEFECVLIVSHPLSLNCERSPALDDDVDRQPVEPRGECRVAAKLAELLPGADENVLCGFVRLMRAEHPP